MGAEVVIGIGVSLLLTGTNMLISSMFTQDVPTREDYQSGMLANKRSSYEHLPLLYGLGRVGINQAYVRTVGHNMENCG
jgi:hypothetical protein